jgi:hypothetical protein
MEMIFLEYRTPLALNKKEFEKPSFFAFLNDKERKNFTKFYYYYLDI